MDSPNTNKDLHSISIIIPARNEELYLPKSLAAIQASVKELNKMFPEVSTEIVIVVNRSSDKTEEIAKNNHCIIVKNDSKNLSQIRNSGAKATSGDIIVTVDADSLISSNMLPAIYKTLSNNKYVGGGVVIYPERWSLGLIVTGLALMPVALWYRISCGLFFCRTTDFWAIGGFDENLCSVEDIDFARRLRRHGLTRKAKFTTLFSAYIITSCRKFDRFGDWFFLKNPFRTYRLFKGRSQADADEVWYDFKR